jgi:hypothetical protein
MATPKNVFVDKLAMSEYLQVAINESIELWFKQWRWLMGTIAPGRNEPSEVIGIWGYHSTFDRRVTGIRKLQALTLWDRVNYAVAREVSGGGSSAVVIHHCYLPNLIDSGDSSNVTNSYPSSLIRYHRSLSSLNVIARGGGSICSGFSRLLKLWVLPGNLPKLTSHDEQLTASNDGIDASAQSSDPGENYRQPRNWTGRFPTALEGLFMFIGILGLGVGWISIVRHVVYSDSFMSLRWTLLVSVVGTVFIIRWVLVVISR